MFSRRSKSLFTVDVGPYKHQKFGYRKITSPCNLVVQLTLVEERLSLIVRTVFVKLGFKKSNVTTKLILVSKRCLLRYMTFLPKEKQKNKRKNTVKYWYQFKETNLCIDIITVVFKVISWVYHCHFFNVKRQLCYRKMFLKKPNWQKYLTIWWPWKGPTDMFII